MTTVHFATWSHFDSLHILGCEEALSPYMLVALKELDEVQS